MGKKSNQNPPTSKRISTRTIKKNDKQDKQQFYEEDEQSNQQNSPHDDQDSDQSDEEGESQNSDDEEADDQDDQSEESTPKINPQNYAIRSMQFRERRGTKMNYLINRKKQQEQDPFWIQQGQKYFGDLDDGDNDQEDYVESSSGRDQFDSDFDQSQSEHQSQPSVEQKQIDQQKQKEKKKRQQLMRMIQAPAPAAKRNVVKTTATTSSTVKKAEKSDAQKKNLSQPTSRYIHQIFNQQELLGEAATTQYFNWLSLKKLISIQTEKKDFTKRQHHIDGPKIIYKNRINEMGIRQQTYQLSDVKINKIQELSEMFNKN